MLVYLFNIGLILFWGCLLIYSRSDNPKRNKKIFCIIVAIQWILVSGLRGISVGADTQNYKRLFEIIKNVSWQDIFNDFINVYVYNAESQFSKDVGYVIFEKFIQLFTSEYQVFLIIIAVILFGTMGKFIYQNSIDPCFSFILFSCLFYSFYAITGLRQTLATSLIVFVGFNFIKEKKLFKFILITVFAFFLHKSALVFFPFYFLSRIKVSKKYLFIVLMFIAIMFISGRSLLLDIASFIGYDKDDVYKADTSAYVLAMIAVGVVVMIFSKMTQNADKDSSIYLNASIIATALSVLTIIDQSMMRVQQYYALFLMCSLPFIMKVFDLKLRLIAKIFCFAVLILYEISKNAHYVFFWQ